MGRAPIRCFESLGEEIWQEGVGLKPPELQGKGYDQTHDMFTNLVKKRRRKRLLNATIFGKLTTILSNKTFLNIGCESIRLFY